MKGLQSCRVAGELGLLEVVRVIRAKMVVWGGKAIRVYDLMEGTV
jgi:hypothetical protein